jgi:putative RecB family exonuclease
MEDETTLKLSPSSASDFKSCPQLFKFRSVDRLPEAASPAAARGTILHAVLERLFSETAERRTPERAYELMEELWPAFQEAEPDTIELSDEEQQACLDDSRKLLANYFRLEDPSLLRAARLEWRVEHDLADISLRGVIDRLEVSADGTWTLTDYKTGRVPGEARELAAFFGLRFYALMCWRAFGILPGEIRLVYLSDPAVLSLKPHERMLLAFERQVFALAKAIRRALDEEDWRARPSPFCMSCPHQAICPAWAEAPAERPADKHPPA